MYQEFGEISKNSRERIRIFSFNSNTGTVKSRSQSIQDGLAYIFVRYTGSDL